MSELKPCPFCGKDMQKRDILDPGEYTVYCNNCGAFGPNDITQKRADEMWNLRRPEDALRARIAELEAATRWIPVEERLPEKNYSDIGGEVIVLLDCPYSRVAAMKFGLDNEFYSGGFGAGAVYWTRYVTHWQPLPQPPEVQE